MDSPAAKPMEAGVRKAFSRKNLWASLPPKVRYLAGLVLSVVPAPLVLGRAFREHATFVADSEWWGRDRIRAYQVQQLRRICSVAYEQSSYYRTVFDKCSFRPDQIGAPEDIRRLPLLSRDIVRDNLPAMCTRRLGSASVDFTSTGGTGGRPLCFYIGSERSAVEFAYLATGWKRGGYRIGNTLAVLRGGNIAKDRTGLHHDFDPLLRNHRYSSLHLSEANIERYLRHMESIGPCFIHAYPSSADAVARYLRRAGRRGPRNVRGILVESEILYSEQRKLIEDVFGARVFSSYGMTEKVAAAAECEHSRDYHVWPTYSYVELLDSNGTEVDIPGERGEIVATGFINDVTPFIRYRTGDFATHVGRQCESCGREHRVLREIEGHRIQESLIARDGTAISWTAVNVHDDTFLNVSQFQFRQDAPGHAVLRVVPAGGWSDDDRERVCERLQTLLRDEVDVRLELTNEIALSPRGKAIYVDQRIPAMLINERAERHEANE